MNPLNHNTVFEDSNRIAVSLPFTDTLRKYHPKGSFPLTEDPLVTKRAAIVGMFVLRPAHSPTFSKPLLDESGFPKSIYDEDLDWTYNVTGLDGGWSIANANSVDAYRLALQYGALDAVIAGSNAVSIEGVATDHGPYSWQPYALGKWNQLASADPNIAEKIMEQRAAWQKMGYISSRKYSALIVFTWSGVVYEGQRDFLEANVFHSTHPDGSEIEIYILTSEAGAERIRSRAHKYGLENRIDKILVVVPPKANTDATTSSTTSTTTSDGLSTDIDISLIPKILYERFDMRVVNHDGGVQVLRAFARAGAMCQMNLTLCRKRSELEVVQSCLKIPEAKRAEVLSNFDSRLFYFFQRPSEDGTTQLKGVPRSLAPVCVLSDEADDVAVVSFDTRGQCVF